MQALIYYKAICPRCLKRFWTLVSQDEFIEYQQEPDKMLSDYCKACMN